jgi:hypothetical protein
MMSWLCKTETIFTYGAKTVARINKLVGNSDNVEVSNSGRIKISGTAFQIRAVSIV